MKFADGKWVRIRPITFINFNVILFIIMIITGTFILQRTRFGWYICTVGGNEQSAALMGLPVGRTKILVYGFNGFCSVLTVEFPMHFTLKTAGIYRFRAVNSKLLLAQSSAELF